MLKTKLAALTVAAGTALAIAPSAHAATDYFMRIDPGPKDTQITGESTDAQFRGWTEIKSFSYSVENPTTIGSVTGGAGAGKTKLDELTIDKNVDATSPQIFQRLAEGKHFNGIEIVARKSGGAPGGSPTAAPVASRYYFSLAFPTSDQQSGEAGDDTPQEELKFSYGGLVQKYVGQTPTGAAKTPIFGLWSQVTNSLNWSDPMPTLPDEMTR
jgi:type VI secretion system secreted protein Hcp